MAPDTSASRTAGTVPIRAVIFDCDGTLVDSELTGMDVLFELAGLEGLRIDRAEAHQRFRGERMSECIAWIGAQLPGKPAGFEADFMLRVRETTAARFRQGLNALPGAFELLSRLEIPFCVATNGPREKVELTLELSGLRSLLGERVFSAYEVGHFKPEPGLFLHAAAALGVTAAHCAVVEDSLPGILAGLAAGMQVYALFDPAALPAELLGRVHCIRSLLEFEV